MERVIIVFILACAITRKFVSMSLPAPEISPSSGVLVLVQEGSLSVLQPAAQGLQEHHANGAASNVQTVQRVFRQVRGLL